MLCRDVMKTSPHSVRATDSVQNAAKKMRDQNIGFLPVCDGGNKVIGTITDRDIALRCVAAGRATTSPIEAFMTRGAVSCLPTDDIAKAHALMGQHKKTRMMCCDEDGTLLGVISLSDMATLTDGPAIMNTLRQVVTREVRA